MEGRVGRPIRLVFGCEAGLGAETVGVPLGGLDRARYLDISKTNQSAAPNDSHAPVLGSIRHLWIGPTGEILARLEDVKGCQPIRRRRRGFSLERQGGVMRDQVAEQEQGNSKDRMERGWLFRNQIGTVKQKARWNEWAKTGTQWGSDLNPSVSFGGVADSSGRVASFPF